LGVDWAVEIRVFAGQGQTPAAAVFNVMQTPGAVAVKFRANVVSERELIWRVPDTIVVKSDVDPARSGCVGDQAADSSGVDPSSRGCVPAKIALIDSRIRQSSSH